MNFKKLTLASLIFTGVASSTMVYASPVPKTTNTITTENQELTVTHITDPEEIQNYYEENNLEYNSDIVELIFIDNENAALDYEINNCELISEFYIKNKTTYTAVDHSNVLRSYNRSHGLVSITDTISIANELSTSGEIGAEAEEFAIEWSETYDYPVILDVYGKYKYIEGDIYEDDVWYDDYLGDFTAKIAIGDAIAVTRVK